jgi:serine/threonine protein phosphatase PrpC
MKCPDCGYQNRTAAQFCHGCGARLPQQHSAVLDTQPTFPAIPKPPDAISPSDTRPLSEASVAFAPLPEGALLRNGQYVVLGLRNANEHMNVYLAEHITPIRLCPECQAETLNPQEQFCSSCGAALSDAEPLDLRYLIHESANEQAFAAQAQLLRMRLEHPGLLLPCDVFVESPYGPARHYLVESEFTPPSAASLPIPQALDLVLEWGADLARAMDYLHSHHVTLREISLKEIAMPGDRAHWAHLSTATPIPPEARATADRAFAQDVRELATVLAYLASGPHQNLPPQMPKQATQAFSQALAGPAGITASQFAAALESALLELRPATGVTLLVGGRTDVGQERSLNEDSLLTLDVSPVYRSVSTSVGLFAVADGMGGHSAGDVASRLAIQTVAQHALSEVISPVIAGAPLSNSHAWMVSVTNAANQNVYDQRESAGSDMGSTLVMALVIGDTATIANVGDSRAYLLTQNGIAQITTDHSLVERLVAAGQITRDEAARHPQRNVIYRVIGDRPDIEIDIFEQRLAPGEALLLCSDGLSGMVPDEQIWPVWQSSTSPQQACDRLVEVANRAGGMDNITVVIVQAAGEQSS